MWDIKPTATKELDCFQGLLVSYCESMGIEHGMIFCGSWGFQFSEDTDKTIGERMSRDLRNTVLSVPPKFHGIVAEFNWRNNVEELRQFIEENLPKGPLILSVDAFYCPYGNTYHEHHQDHYVLIIGFDGKSLRCVDTYIAHENIVELDLEELKDWSGAIYPLCQIECSPVRNDYINEMETIKAHVTERKMIDNLIRFKDALVNIGDFQKEKRDFGKNLHLMPILVELHRVFIDRTVFSKTITYLEKIFDRHDLFEGLADKFITLASMYENMKNAMIVQILQNKPMENVNGSRLDAIIQLESEALEQFNMILDKLR